MCFCFLSNDNCHFSDPAKRVVDFPRERDTFRNKILEIVQDFACESKISSFFFLCSSFFSIFFIFSFFPIFSFYFNFSFFPFFSFIFFHVPSFSLSFFFHFPRLFSFIFVSFFHCIIIVRWADLSDFLFRRFSSEKCVFLFHVQ